MLNLSLQNIKKFYIRKMKFLSLFIIILFVNFQFAPSFNCLVENRIATSYSSEMPEEEEEESSKENKVLNSDFVNLNNLDSTFIFFENNLLSNVFYLISEYKTEKSIVIHPPKLV